MYLKRILILAGMLILVSATAGIAREVGKDRARSVAQNWLHHLSMQHVLRGSFAIPYEIVDEEVAIFRGQVVGYNFILFPQGHILVPSRDELPPVKLHSDTTPLRMADLSDVAQWIMEELCAVYETIDHSREGLDRLDFSDMNEGLWSLFEMESPASFQSDYAATAVSGGVLIGPLLSTWWGQGDPYNMDCPLWSTGERTVTGCTATAAAQIMKYWNYPATGQGFTSYTWNDGQKDTILSRDFGQSTYNWGLMESQYGSLSGPEKKDAVARLISDVGIAFHMNYGKASISDPNLGTTVFPTYFKYKPTVSVVHRTDYFSDGAWMGVFKNEVQNNRPSLLKIKDPNQGVGHAVVVDGYTDFPSDQIHVNLGWNGSYDGWYASNNIVAGSNHFTDLSWQDAVIGIEPQTASCVSPTIPLNLLPQSNAVGIGTNPTLSWSASANATSYNVFLGQSLPPPLVGTTTGTTYSPASLNPNALYYWYVAATHDCGQVSYSTSGTLWSFHTAPETVSTPDVPTGSTTGTTGVSYSFTTGGSISSVGHPVEYQFAWKGDESDVSPWGGTTQTHAWTVPAMYNVKARARCATDTSVVSNWSSAFWVTINPETVSVPNIPSGPATGTTGASYSFTTGGSASSLGHTVEYQFDWKGDGSDLSPWGSSKQSRTWTQAGVYTVRARARCKTDPGIVSAWSNGFTVTLGAAPSSDLAGEWISLTQTCKNTRSGSQCKLTGSFNVRNAGSMDTSSSFYIGFYLSLDGVFSGDDTPLKQVSVGKLKKGTGKKISLSVTLGSGVKASSHYVIAVLDAQNAISESDKSNNQVSYGPIP